MDLESQVSVRTPTCMSVISQTTYQGKRSGRCSSVGSKYHHASNPNPQRAILRGDQRYDSYRMTNTNMPAGQERIRKRVDISKPSRERVLQDL